MIKIKLLLLLLLYSNFLFSQSEFWKKNYDSISQKQLENIKIPTLSLEEYEINAHYGLRLYHSNVGDSNLRGITILTLLFQSIDSNVQIRNFKICNPQVKKIINLFSDSIQMHCTVKPSDLQKIIKNLCDDNYNYIFKRIQNRGIFKYLIFAITSFIIICFLINYKYRKRKIAKYFNFFIIISIIIIILVFIFFKLSCSYYVKDDSFYGMCW